MMLLNSSFHCGCVYFSAFLEACAPQFDDSQPQRETILKVASEILNNESVMSWKTDCDKAIKKLFPLCKTKRKGPPKAKTYPFLEHFRSVLKNVVECDSCICELSYI